MDPKGNGFSPITLYIVLGKGTQTKMIPSKMFSFLSSSDYFLFANSPENCVSEENPGLSSEDLVLVKICWEIFEVHWFKCPLW